jgi:hypothetical protein
MNCHNIPGRDWVETATQAMKARRNKLQREVEDLDGYIAEAEAWARGTTPVGRPARRRQKLLRLLQNIGEATVSQIASLWDEALKRDSIAQTLRDNPELFEKCGKDGRQTKWRLKQEER